MILKHGAKVNALDKNGQTALHRCARDGNVQVKIRLVKGSNPAFISLFS